MSPHQVANDECTSSQASMKRVRIFDPWNECSDDVAGGNLLARELSIEHVFEAGGD